LKKHGAVGWRLIPASLAAGGKTLGLGYAYVAFYGAAGYEMGRESLTNEATR
jgi:hypothetical protein